MIKLYHNALSTCAQKVRFVFAEKGLDFDSHEIDLLAGQQHEEWYVKLNPKHVVPTIEHQGHVLTESSLIIQYLDAIADTNPLMPQDPYAQYQAGKWIRLIDDAVHPAAPVITFAIGPRPMLLQQPEEVREANIAAMPNERSRAIRRSVIEHGVKAPEFAGALKVFMDMLDQMEEALSNGPWLVGDQISLADASVLPYVVRLEHMALGRLFTQDNRPRVRRWFTEIEQRPTYQKAVADWAPDFVLDMFKTNGEAVWADIEAQLT